MEGYNPEHNYCTFFPDKMFGVKYNYGCYLHDRHYRNERKNRLPRKSADLLLKRKVKEYFDKAGLNKLGTIWSYIMYKGTRWFAWIAWVK